MRRRPPYLVRAILLLAAFLLATPPAKALDPAAAREKFQHRYREELAKLADWCEAENLAEEARLTRDWVVDPPPATIVVYRVSELSTLGTDGEFNKAWQAKFMSLREKAAAALFRQARQAAESENATAALNLLQQTLRENPDHAQARAILGFERYKDRWLSAAAVKKLKSGQVRHEKFGWLPAEHVARYEKDERHHRGRWISAEEDARLHEDISRGWKIETEHFAVTTNHSLEEGILLVDELERLFHAWWIVFGGYHTSAAEVKRAIDTGRPLRIGSRRHEVVYFRNRDEYNAALAARQPGIERSLGIYFPDAKTSYFFAGEDQDPGTIFHEATHQLFQETRGAKDTVGLANNFWIVEGLACYMESLARGSGNADYDTVGGLDRGRLPAARQRLLDDSFYVPFAELAALGRDDFQRHPQARSLYSQIAGQTAFLIHGQNGRYREPLIEYVRAVYRNQAKPNTLAELCKTMTKELDRQYREFLQGE